MKKMKKQKTDKLRDLVLNLVDREPGLLFDLLEGVEDRDDPQTGPSDSVQVPSWCKCSFCRQNWSANAASVCRGTVFHEDR